MNKRLGLKGRLWQEESFDHIMRGYEDVQEKSEYICMNPVRAGLVPKPEDYPWLWQNFFATAG